MDWWKSYFQSSWELHQKTVKTDSHTQWESAFLDYWMTQNDFQSVLDVPCSTGRIAIALAQKGYEVTALDYNTKLLEIGKREEEQIHFEAIKAMADEADADDGAIAGDMGLSKPVNWMQGDMRNLPFEAEFDMVACVFNSFGYFDESGNEAFLQSAVKSLRKGGHLLLDCHIAETLLPIFTPQSGWRFKDCLVYEERTYSYKQSRMNGKWVTVDLNTKDIIETESSIRVYTYRELTQLLSKCGFGHFETFGNYDGDPFQFGDDGVILIAEKL